MSIRYRADWVLPISSPPIEDGWVEVAAGRIVAVGSEPARLRQGYGGSAGALRAKAETPNLEPEPRTVILPGLVNAHTHLELSWMAGRVPPSDSMGRWIRSLMALRLESPPALDAQREAIVAAIVRARASGTAAFGDIGNSLRAAEPLAEADMPAVLFHEMIGFGRGDARAKAEDGARAVREAVRPPVRAGLAPHAPYSVSPDLFRAVADVAARNALPSSVHLGESAEEVEFLREGTGEIAATLRHLGAWNDDWMAPQCDPADYLDRLGVLRPGLLVVHATQLGPAALARLAARRCVIVSCPRSNRWVGAGDPPLDAFYASSTPVAFGTDSLASVADLDMFAELAAARAISAVPARTLLESATRVGAAALGLGRELGTIEPGKRAALLAVRVPPDVSDVEEYLVGGIDSGDARWL